MLFLCGLFGLVVRESRCFSRLEPTMRMDKSCCFCVDFSALWRGKVGILVGCVCLVPVNTASRACEWLPHTTPMAPTNTRAKPRHCHALTPTREQDTITRIGYEHPDRL